MQTQLDTEAQIIQEISDNPGFIRTYLEGMVPSLLSFLVQVIVAILVLLSHIHGIFRIPISIQQSETGLHLSDIGTVLVREFRRNRPAVEAQLHHREVVGGGARTQRA